MYAAYLVSTPESGLDPLLALPLVRWRSSPWAMSCSAASSTPSSRGPSNQQFLLLLAVATILTASLLIGFGPDARNVQVDYAYDSFEVGPLLLDKVRVIAALGALLAVAALLWGFFRFTRTGKSIRACADNQIGAAVVGLDVQRLYALTFGIGAACVGAAGVPDAAAGRCEPYVAADYTLLAFIIVIVGGLGSMPGACSAACIVGVAEALAARFIEPSLKSVISFAPLILVLLVRPQGLAGPRMSGLLAARRFGASASHSLLLAALPARRQQLSRLGRGRGALSAYVGQAWNIMMGFAGQLSLGHALYVGLGAYIAAALFTIAASALARHVRRPSRLPGAAGAFIGCARASASARRRLFRAADDRLRRVHPHRLRSFAVGRIGRAACSCRCRIATMTISLQPARRPVDVLLLASWR